MIFISFILIIFRRMSKSKLKVTILAFEQKLSQLTLRKGSYQDRSQKITIFFQIYKIVHFVFNLEKLGTISFFLWLVLYFLRIKLKGKFLNFSETFLILSLRKFSFSGRISKNFVEINKLNFLSLFFKIFKGIILSTRLHNQGHNRCFLCRFLLYLFSKVNSNYRRLLLSSLVGTVN